MTYGVFMVLILAVIFFLIIASFFIHSDDKGTGNQQINSTSYNEQSNKTFEINRKIDLLMPKYKKMIRDEVINNEANNYVLDEFHNVFGFGSENLIFSDTSYYDAFMRCLLCAGLVDVDFYNGKLISGKANESKYLYFNLSSYQEFKKVVNYKYADIEDKDIFILCLFNEILIKTLSANCMFTYDKVDVSSFEGCSIKDVIWRYFELYSPIEKPNVSHLSAYILYNGFYDDVYYVIRNANSSIEQIQIERKANRFDGNSLMQKEKNITIDDIDLMTGREFEEFITNLFIKMGCSAHTTKESGDQGIDVIAEKNGIKYGVQCKCYANTVGNSAIQEVVAGKQFYKLDKLIVVTNNYFTKSAQNLASANDVILWDRTILKEKL